MDRREPRKTRMCRRSPNPPSPQPSQPEKGKRVAPATRQPATQMRAPPKNLSQKEKSSPPGGASKPPAATGSSFPCQFCPRSFLSNRGLLSHKAHCLNKAKYAEENKLKKEEKEKGLLACQFCNKKYSKVGMPQHMKKSHPVEFSEVRSKITKKATGYSRWTPQEDHIMKHWAAKFKGPDGELSHFLAEKLGRTVESIRKRRQVLNLWGLEFRRSSTSTKMGKMVSSQNLRKEALWRLKIKKKVAFSPSKSSSPSSSSPESSPSSSSSSSSDGER